MRVRTLPSARRHLIEITRYLAAENVGAARRFKQDFRAAVERVRNTPRMGRPAPHLGSKARTVSVWNYLLLYRVNDEMIDIVAVVHQRRRDPLAPFTEADD